jgi:hypothetical protein
MWERVACPIVVMLPEPTDQRMIQWLRETPLSVECPPGWSPALVVLREDMWRPQTPRPSVTVPLFGDS